MARRDTTGPQNRGRGSNGDIHPITKIPSSLNPGLTRRRLFGLAGAAFASLALARLGVAQAAKRLTLVADGVTDDAVALEAWGNGKDVWLTNGAKVGAMLTGLRMFTSRSIPMNLSGLHIFGCRVRMPASASGPVITVGPHARNMTIMNCMFMRDVTL